MTSPPRPGADGLGPILLDAETTTPIVRWNIDPDRLSAAMVLRRMTGSELARQARVSGSLVRNLRNGYYTVTTRGTLDLLVRALRVRPEDIATPTEEAGIRRRGGALD